MRNHRGFYLPISGLDDVTRDAGLPVELSGVVLDALAERLYTGVDAVPVLR